MKTLKYILLIKLIFLITGCEKIYVKPAGSNQNMSDFEAAWNRVNDVYPFLAFKDIDWDNIYFIYKDRTEQAKGDEFYQVLNDLLAELKDGHVYFRTEGGGEIYPFYPQRHFKDRHLYNPFVIRNYFDKELTVTDSKAVEYEILPGNIGYVFLSDFHENYLIKEFPIVINYMINTKGIIIDIRQKRGGSIQNIEAVISHFITQPMDWPKFYLLGELIPLSPIQPKNPIFTKPVVVLINGSTFSAGEVCTEIFKQLPNATIVGDTTGGGGAASSSNPPNAKGDYYLPSGKLICIGTGYFERYDGAPFEWNGITPDVRILNSITDLEAGLDNQLEYAIDLINSIK